MNHRLLSRRALVDHRRTIIVYCVIATTSLGLLVFSLTSGTVEIGLGELWGAMHSRGTISHSVLVDLRLPRALAAFAAGGALALAGALMQVLLRNPLADPFVMGVSGGAAAAALSAMLVGFTGLGVDIAAAAGAFAAAVLVFALSRSEGGWSPLRLLLTGVIVAAAASAAVGMLLALGDDDQLRGMLFWLMGDLAYSKHPSALLLTFAVGLLVAALFARHLNVLAYSELQARLLGAPVDALRIGVFLVSSVLTAACVTTAGPIGFVGLVSPHIARMLLGSDHRVMLPAAALLGGSLVMSADLAARTVFAPRQLPVGAVTALIGAPLFLILMRREARKS